MTYFARKTTCNYGHSHASRAEANRCHLLHIRQRAGEIKDLEIEPQFWFVIAGQQVKHENGRRVGYKPDFGYTENGREVVEEIKAKNLHLARDVPLRMALFRHLFPAIELRVVK